MADDRHFSKLASGLTLEERQALLKKLKAHSILSYELLYIEDDPDISYIDIDMEFSWLPGYRRLWYKILSIFKSKSPKKVYEDQGVAALGKKIMRKFPKMYNHRTGMLLPGFYKQVIKLKDSANFFYSALDASVNRNRNSFFAFLGSLEMPDVHNMLQDETDISVIASRNPNASEREWRALAIRAMDDAFSKIDDEYRSAMYSDARSLFCLKELSTFSYDRLVSAFSYNRAEGGESCYAVSVRELLISLNDILFSLKTVPHMTLLQSLFVFMLRRRANEPSFDFDMEINTLLLRAEESLAVIREFNKKVPINMIIRCSSRDMSAVPKEISGGEDWYAVFRDYWKKHVETACNDFIRSNRHQKAIDSFRDFLKGRDFEALENTYSSTNPEGLPIKGSLSLSFLATFHSVVFMPDLNPILSNIYNNGEFKDEDFRVEYSWSYNYILRLEEEINKFEQGISPTGIYGERYAQTYNERSTSIVRKRRLQLVLDKVQRDANNILDQAKKSCQNLIDILSGIVGENAAEKRVFLLNFVKLSGADEEFISAIEDTVGQLKTTIRLLDEIEKM
ncbi:MAG: DUF5312 domain-containing protein [Treponema sp.]|nr:DUF5312 domain-containing protein [Treponema sp.]